MIAGYSAATTRGSPSASSARKAGSASGAAASSGSEASPVTKARILEAVRPRQVATVGRQPASALFELDGLGQAIGGESVVVGIGGGARGGFQKPANLRQGPARAAGEEVQTSRAGS